MGYILDVCVSGSYAYVTKRDSGGFWVVDVSDPTNPYRVGFCSQPTGEYIDIFVSGSYVYAVGLEDGFLVVDVSDPTAPFVVSRYHVEYARAVSICDQYAFVTTFNGFLVIDISDPLNPIKVNTYVAGSWLSPEILFISEPYAF
ncbi:hypothetical protein KAV67_00935, partial [Candidatus Bipolaricaulota bacterium]|nr:hypothetical protein [Candidatus Bipolaricaulota bacterium]